MGIESSQALQYMKRVAEAVEKGNEVLEILGYLGGITDSNSFINHALKAIFFQLSENNNSPYSINKAHDKWDYAINYCESLIEQGLTKNDCATLSSDGLDYLSRLYPDVYLLIEDNVYDQLSENVHEAVSSRIESKEVAYQFIIEELEAASMGNEEAQAFVAESHLSFEEIQGSMANSSSLVDGADGPQQTLTRLIMNLNLDMIYATRIRIRVVKKITADWFQDDTNRKDIDWDDVF
jgi:hypothetical protein